MVRVPGGPPPTPMSGGLRKVAVDDFYIGRTEVTWDISTCSCCVSTHRRRVPARMRSPGPPSRTARPTTAGDMPATRPSASRRPRRGVLRMAFREDRADLPSADRGRVGPRRDAWPTRGRIGVARRHRLASRTTSAGQVHPVAPKTGRRARSLRLVRQRRRVGDDGDGTLVTRGGSYRDPPRRWARRARAVQDRTWNERDPQLPKSRWWLSDGPFVGFRVVSARIRGA